MLGVTMAACKLRLRAMFLRFWRFHGMPCSGTYWLLGGGLFQCMYGGFWMISYYLMFLVVRGSLVFSGFGLKSHASGFQSYSSSSLKSSPTIQHSF